MLKFTPLQYDNLYLFCIYIINCKISTNKYKVKQMTLNLKNIVLNERQICDLELILNGAFKPLNKFMGKKDYESVLDNMRLSTGELWPIPINLDIDKKTKEEYDLKIGSEVALRDHEGFLIATLNITEIWKI